MICPKVKLRSETKAKRYGNWCHHQIQRILGHDSCGSPAVSASRVHWALEWVLLVSWRCDFGLDVSKSHLFIAHVCFTIFLLNLIFWCFDKLWYFDMTLIPLYIFSDIFPGLPAPLSNVSVRLPLPPHDLPKAQSKSKRHCAAQWDVAGHPN